MSRCLKIALLILIPVLPIASFGMERTELLPPEAQAYVRITNTTNFWTRLKASPLGQLWADQQFQDFLGNPDAETWQELFFANESTAEDEVFLEQLKMLNGEVILAFDTEHDDPYLVAAISEADFQRSLELDENLADLAHDTFDIVRSTFQDVEIIQHIDHPGEPRETSSWQTFVNNTLVLGYSREWIEQCIVTLKKETVKEPEGNPILNLNIPLAKLIQHSIDSKKSRSQESALLTALGLLDIERLTAQLELKESEMVADNVLSISNLERGLFTILDVQPSELPTVTFIPENISSIEVGRVNLLRFWREIPNVLLAAQPGMKPQFDMLLAMIQQQAGINIELDLLANIGTRYISFAVAENEGQRSVVAVDLKDGAAFKKGLETAMAAPAMQPYVAAGIDIQEFLDHTIYVQKNASETVPNGLAISGDYLLYGAPEGLRQVIRSITSDAAANQSFERSELVKGLRRHVPPRAFAYSAIDWKTNIDVLMGELSKPKNRALIQQQWARSGAALPPPDFSKLPPADHIASFFNTSYQYLEASIDGLHQRIILKY
ncbi:MAG: hypothetical protein KJN67_01795 [Pontiella sp.]|nr:hypothetical protein [Pontiella sp.]